MITSLYLMNVLPASMPSAALKTIVIVGPSLRMRWTAIPTPTSAARTGMIHTIDRRLRLGATTVACGSSTSSLGSAMRAPARLVGVPDQPRIERVGRDHRQHDHRHEVHDADARRHRHQRV